MLCRRKWTQKESLLRKVTYVLPLRTVVARVLPVIVSNVMFHWLLLSFFYLGCGEKPPRFTSCTYSPSLVSYHHQILPNSAIWIYNTRVFRLPYSYRSSNTLLHLTSTPPQEYYNPSTNHPTRNHYITYNPTFMMRRMLLVWQQLQQQHVLDRQHLPVFLKQMFSPSLSKSQVAVVSRRTGIAELMQATPPAFCVRWRS